MLHSVYKFYNRLWSLYLFFKITSGFSIFLKSFTTFEIPFLMFIIFLAFFEVFTHFLKSLSILKNPFDRYGPFRNQHQTVGGCVHRSDLYRVGNVRLFAGRSLFLVIWAQLIVTSFWLNKWGGGGKAILITSTFINQIYIWGIQQMLVN